MKKTYMNPEMEIIKIASKAQMLAGSQEAPVSGSQDNTSALGHDDDFDW